MQRLTITLLITASLAACADAPQTPSQPLPAQGYSPVRILADFEAPETPMLWLPSASAPPSPPSTAASTSATQPTPPVTLMRSSLRPQSGLWSAKVTIPGAASSDSGTHAYTDAGGGDIGGTLWFTPVAPLDLGQSNLLQAGILHLATPHYNGRWTASLILEDTQGTRVEGDAFPITAHWDQAEIDLNWAFDQGVDISRLKQVGLILRPLSHTAPPAPSSTPSDTPTDATAPPPPFEIQTDTWKAFSRGKAYIGNRLASDSPKAASSFFVESQGARLRVGTTGGNPWEISFHNRGTTPDPRFQRPWMEIWTSLPPSPQPSPPSSSAPTPRSQRLHALGPPGTGLMLLAPDTIAGLALQRGPDDTPPPPEATLPSLGWPLATRASPGNPSRLETTASSRWHWEVVWTSPVAAIIEVKQESGPYDRLGEPAVLLTWRFMIYQWGQVFIRAEWTRGEMRLPDPVSWALILPEDLLPAPIFADVTAERLLTEVYPAAIRDGLQTALPHRMQSGAPVAIISRPPPALARNAWWWTRGKTHADDTLKKLAGAALSPAASAAVRGQADCMLLVNAPNPLMKAAAFGQYLVPPKVLFRQGELDRNFPGDLDNDGFVESYGFQTIRLANGRATFTLYPQGRPILYPACLFTVPAIERETLDLAQSRILINIDGKQFADPPQFPDGSFLLQLPFTLDRPVTVEALLIKK